MQRLLIGFCALFSLAVHAAPLTPPKGQGGIALC